MSKTFEEKLYETEERKRFEFQTYIEYNDRLLSTHWNDASLLVFHKYFNDLNNDEIKILEKYVYDYLYPEWKSVLDDDGNDTGYKINNLGIVKGKRGNYLRNDISMGYYRISGYYNGHPYALSIHREVAKAFIPNPENKPQVNHINGNKLFNWVGNLEWNTSKENTDHAVDTGLMNTKGILHPENVYTIDQIKSVCKLLEDPKMKNVEIAKLTGVNRSIVYSIRYGKSWTHISSEYNIYQPPRKKGNSGYKQPKRAFSPKTQFVYDSLKNNVSKDEIADALVCDYGFQRRDLALRSINKIIRRHMRDDK